METETDLNPLTLDYETIQFEHSWMVNANCTEWMRRVADNSIHAVVTDAPCAAYEYDDWRRVLAEHAGKAPPSIRPSFDGHSRAAFRHFRYFSKAKASGYRDLFRDWSRSLCRIMRPGAHLFICLNPFITHSLYGPIMDSGLEYFGQIIRLVRAPNAKRYWNRTVHGCGDVSPYLRSGYEPWGVFRKKLPRKMTIPQCLSEWGTGGLRNRAGNIGVEDVFHSPAASRKERRLADDPQVKPQSFLQQLVRTALPRGGVVLDPFAGSGATIAAAEALGASSIGIERDPAIFRNSRYAVEHLQQVRVPDCDFR